MFARLLANNDLKDLSLNGLTDVLRHLDPERAILLGDALSELDSGELADLDIGRELYDEDIGRILRWHDALTVCSGDVATIW